jgi:hypothetical protein
MKELDIDGLTLSNAAGGALEEQFQDEVRRIVAACDHSEDFEATKDGSLKYTVQMQLTIEVNPVTRELWCTGSAQSKAPKRRARKQTGRLHNGKLWVDASAPLPVQKPLTAVGG